MFTRLDQLDSVRRITHIIEGEARGADTLARLWAQARGRVVCAFPADWSRGKSAGYVRNKQMLEEGKPDAVVAFPGGRGTDVMLALAKDAGVPTVQVA